MFVVKTIFQHLLMQLPELFPNGQFKHRLIFGNVSDMDDFGVKEEWNFFAAFYVAQYINYISVIVLYVPSNTIQR